VVGVLERVEWWGCWRGRGGESAGEGGVVRVMGEREELRECFRGMRGGTAGEGGVVRVLDREGRWECWRGRSGENT
jgi:hypothetical protein